MRLMLPFVVWMFAALLCSAGASAESTHWIGPDRSEISKLKRFDFILSFALRRKPTRAVLRIGVDFCAAKIVLNGRAIARSDAYSLAIPIPVHRWCKVGENQLTVYLECDGGPLAFALELECDGQIVVRSHEGWSRADRKDEDVKSFGLADQEHWWSLTTRPSVSDFDEYNQWKLATKDQHTAKLQIKEGFDIEEIYRVPEKLGSWISMALDDRGRLIVGREKSGVLRVTLPSSHSKAKVETLAESLKGCHGVLWSNGQVFVNASDSKALYRLRDTNGDDQFDELRRLREIPGGGGDHGRNDLVKGPDGAIYSIHGDAVNFPNGFSSSIPVTRELAAVGAPKGGHMIRTDEEGSRWEVVSSGLRNPYGIAFNKDGEPFTYDADSERHVGLPWYRPTRMNHLVSGTDYGWRNRNGEQPWPIYLPDILPPNVLIGRGSPTSIKFGYDSHFSRPYKNALFAPDWSFGRIFAVHVVPRGASYSMHPDTFMRGMPLNVCDVEFDDDGRMLLLTGGYGTRSILYRVRQANHNADVETKLSQQQRDREAYSQKMRSLRRELEQADSLSFCWEHLNHPDRWIRHAARIGLERQAPATWEDHVWNEVDNDVLLPALLALVRMMPDLDEDRAWEKLYGLNPKRLNSDLQLHAVRIAQWLDEYHHVDGTEKRGLATFEELYPTGVSSVDRELCSLLSEHLAETLPQKTLDLIATSPPQIDLLHYLMVLAKTKQGWTKSAREEFFQILRGARYFKGDEGLPQIVEGVIREALQQAPEADRPRYLELLAEDESVRDELLNSSTKRVLVKDWALGDFADISFEQGATEDGRKVFHDAQCSKCHRFGAVGRSVGPDLTGVAGRYRPEEILEAILAPSKEVSSRYRNHVIITSNGKTHTGQIVWNGFRKSIIRLATDPVRLDSVIEVAKSDIESRHPSTISPMPTGLLNSFQRDEVISLLKYLTERN